MSQQRFIALAVAALIAIGAALYLSAQRNLPHDVHGLPLLPALATELDTVTSLSVIKGSATPAVTVYKQGDQWAVEQRANYPADSAKVRKLLLALNDAKIREEKTSNPDSYSVIGVEDPSKAGAGGAQIELLAKSGKLAVIVGKSAAEGNFVRRAGEKTSYLAEPGISFEAEPRYWIDPRLIDIKADQIQSIELKPATGPGYTLRRVTEPAPKPDAKPAAPAPTSAKGAPSPAPAPAAAPPAPPPVSKFVLDTVPAGRQAADQATLAPGPTTLSGLTDDDVSALGELDFSKPSVAIVTLTDGSTLTFSGVVVGDKHWIQVSAPKDASLSAKTKDRAFDIAGYRYEGIFRPLEQLLVPKPAPPAPPSKKTTPAAPKP